MFKDGVDNTLCQMALSFPCCLLSTTSVLLFSAPNYFLEEEKKGKKKGGKNCRIHLCWVPL